MTIQPTAQGTVDIEFKDVSKSFGDIPAVDHVSLTITRGSFHSLLGPSGCGKTTSLRLIAGFEQPTAGDIRIAGQSVVGIPAYRRPVNMVFQHYALFPHLDVAANIGYGLKQRSPRTDRVGIARRVDEMLELVRMSGMHKRRTWELSGGQQQRVALARALINQPTVLLLDEPLAALDRKLRHDMQIELQTLQREVGITFVLVTHDQEEALSMSDTVSVMREGKILQCGSPQQVYDAPVNRYVADFVGESNFFAGEVVAANPAGATVRTRSGLVLSAPYPLGVDTLGLGAAGVIAVRPEMVRLWRTTPPPDASEMEVSLAGQVRNRIYLGDQTKFSVATAELGDILVRVGKDTAALSDEFSPGNDVTVGWRRDRALALADG